MVRTLEQLRHLVPMPDGSKALPRFIHLQLDNCWRENKNTTILGYCAWLVWSGAVETVHIGYLPVG